VDQCFGADEGLDVLDLSEEGLLRLVEDARLIRDFCLGLLGEVRNFDFCLLLDLHEIFLDFLDLGLVLCYFLIELLLLQVLLQLRLLYLDVQVLLLLQQLTQLVLVLQLVSDERVELLRRAVLYELD
jgi:hypothetical protein